MNVALVNGSAACVDEDVAALEAMIGQGWPGTVVAVNDMIWRWPRIVHHAATLHAENLPDWLKRRKQRGYPDVGLTWTARGHEARGAPTDMVLGEIMRDGLSEGSTGLFGVQVGMTVRPKVVLCGIPMNRQKHVEGATAQGPFLTANQKADEKKVATYLRVWERESSRLQGRVKSMSGTTREMFGAPTPEWLREQ